LQGVLRPLSTSHLLIAAVVCLAGCESNPSVPPPIDAGGDAAADAGAFVCNVTPPTSCPDPPLHYPDVAPIFQERCVTCHYGAPGGPWPLLQYEHVAAWYDVIQGNMLDCSMPPPESLTPMTNEERVAILTWILCGFLP